jgi:lipoate-protein ligase A
MSGNTLTWRFLDTEQGSAMFNMALDMSLFRSVSNGSGRPTIRFFSWEHDSITVGYTQKATDILDCDRCIHDGIDVARRPTGGRCVFHAREIAYSLIGPVYDSVFGGSIMETYRAVSMVFCKALKDLGYHAELSPGKIGSGRPGSSPSPCFASTSRYEVTIDGRKVIGSAQRRVGNFFLQQGSILIGNGHERIVAYLKDRRQASLYAEALDRHSITLESTGHAPVTLAEIKTSMENNFLQTLNGHLINAEPACDEIAEAEKSIDTCNALKGCGDSHER